MNEATKRPSQTRRGRMGRPRREEAADIDNRLLVAAVHMFTRHGAGVTMNAIVEESGLSRKTVYARYPHKSALFRAVWRHLLDAGSQQALEIPPRETPEESLYAFILTTLQEMCMPEAMALRRLLLLDPEFMDQMRQNIEMTIVRRYTDPLLAFLQQLAAQRMLNEVDLKRTSQSLMNLILAESNRRFSENSSPPQMGELEQLARHFLQLFCFGIMGKQPSNDHD